VSKMKTHSGAKKRLRTTGGGLVLRGQTGKRHQMRRRSQDMKRAARGTTVMKECDAGIVRRHLLPYGGR